MPRRIRYQALLCHVMALLWLPLSGLLGYGLVHWRVTQMMFIGSLSFFFDLDHSANFAGAIWLVMVVLISLVTTLWIPLAIALSKETPDPLVRQSAIHAFNALMTYILTIAFATGVVTQLDRVTEDGETLPWIAWSLVFLVMGIAFVQVICVSVAGRRSLQGKSFRYPFSLPILR